MDEIWIETEQGKIYGQAAGNPSDPVIIGIHGFSQRNGWQTWAPLVDPLAAAGYYVIAIDMPGWGQSPKWEKTAGKSAIVALLDSLGVDKAHALMGKSWGGGVVLEFAQTYPDQVNKLILTAPAYRGQDNALKRMPQPTLLVWAEDDPVIGYGMAGQYLKLAPQWEFVSYLTGGHSAAPENAEAFAPVAIEFLKS